MCSTKHAAPQVLPPVSSIVHIATLHTHCAKLEEARAMYNAMAYNHVSTSAFECNAPTVHVARQGCVQPPDAALKPQQHTLPDAAAQPNHHLIVTPAPTALLAAAAAMLAGHPA